MPPSPDPTGAADPDLLEGLLTALRADEAGARAAAAKALGRLGPKAAEAVEGLRCVLGDDDPLVRAMAASALGKIGPAAAAAAADLAGLLEDPAPPVRFWACDALGRLGPAAHVALPALRTTCAEDEHEAVRRGALLAIRLLAIDDD